MNTLEEGAAFLEKVNHAHVKLLVDTFHMNIEEDNMFTSIKNIFPRLVVSISVKIIEVFQELGILIGNS